MTYQTTPPVRRSILLVEDEAMIAMMLEEFVDTLGHHVSGVATTVEDACRMVESGGFDLAILDCHLEGQEVWPVAEMLDRKGIPYILSSGGSITDVPAPFAQRPMLAKPYTIGTISDMLMAA
ncbi:MAG: response regulator [Sphingobium sp.]|nr:response regulator [Sphingobium sp.]MCP5398679.1 response regulator [Sphingomonas sp.]